jgi:hypothetical protein
MPIDGEKYKFCIPAYFQWSPDKTDFTNQNIKFLWLMMIGLMDICGGKVVDTVKI